ncbi:MAG TPA: class I SAM-dependent methyltransferase [Chthoniobacterales bacterium]|nr:class I SAM-dependent methyltransferase [Chthoniobacterales bacterium]
MKELLHLPRDWSRKMRRAGRRRLFPELDRHEASLKLPLAVLLDAIYRASPGSRVKLFRRLLPYLRAADSSATAETCHIESLADFASGYARLATMLGRAGKIPPPGEIEFLRTIVDRSSTQHPGTIASDDYFFLTALVSILAPERVVEVGTLTGFSAAIIAAALRRQCTDDAVKWVDTIDLAADCFIDQTRPTGFEIAESFPELAPVIRIHTPQDSTLVSKLATPDELEIVFIDADHQHPLPLLDLLRVAPYIRPGGWVVLHDIQLGTKAREANSRDETLRWGAAEGAELLFESWPFRKIGGGNIGAIQLPNDKSALVAFALRLMSLPYEIKGSRAEAIHRALHRSFAALL